MSNKMREIKCNKQSNGILRILSKKCIAQIIQFMFKMEREKWKTIRASNDSEGQC
jgi:hypothetical protein